jgi:hypothetical protein
MWRVFFVLVLIEQNGLAIPPLPVEHPWVDAVTAAAPALAACKRDAEAKHLVGDVIVSLQLEHRVWAATASASLGAHGPRIAACARAAIEKHFVVHVERYVEGFERYGKNTHALTIGDPTTVLPPPAKLLPAWRAAIAPGATKAQEAAFAKLVPLDYKLDHGCLIGQRPYVTDVEASWVEHAGTLVSGMWRAALAKLTPTTPWLAVWNGQELVTEGRGMCLVTLDAAAEALVRPEIDRAGTCWAGSLVDILTHPRVEFPRDRSYTQVDVHYGRACAVTTTGDVTCCGAVFPALAAALPRHVTQVAIGIDFTCGLDAAGNVTCTGSITTAPRGPFRKLNAAHDRVCGLHRDGTIECWGASGVKPVKLAGTFVDVAADQETWGVHTDGTLECTTSEGKAMRPPGSYRAVAMVFGAVCGLRRDNKLGCFEAFTRDTASAVSTLLPDAWTDVAIADGNACGRRADRTIACADGHPAMKPHRPAIAPPPGPFVQLAGEGQQFCGVTAAGQIACWGRRWPEETPIVSSPDTHGTIVDERGAPIAGAEVMLCDEAGPCSWVASLARTDSSTLASLANQVKDPKGWTIVTTKLDGTWHVASQATRVGAVITAPGREVRALDVQSREELAAPIVLRPASTIDLAAWCDGHACTTPKLGDGRRIWDGTHLEHVAPGTYHLIVWNDQGSKYEKVGAIDLEMPFAVKPLTARVVLRDTGTKHDIHGTVEIPGEQNLEGHGVTVRCTGAAVDTWRDARTDRKGAFDVPNIGALPCRIDVAGAAMELTRYTDKIELHGNVPRGPHRR